MHLMRSQYRILMFMVAALGMMGFLTIVAYLLDESLDETQPADDGKTRNAHYADIKVDVNAALVPQGLPVPAAAAAAIAIKTAPSVAGMKSGDLMMHIDPEKALVLGHARQTKGFLTIGIPTSHAGGAGNNLKWTLTLLIQNTGAAERSRVTIVVLARDLDEKSRQETRRVVGNFTDPLRSGMLQLIEAPRSLHRAAGGEAPGPGNDFARENLDTAFLISYAGTQSEYYLHLGDSVAAAPGYVRAISDFVKAQKGQKPWVSMGFSPEPFTGKLIRLGGRHQAQLTHLLVEFADKLPASKLFESFEKLNAQIQPFAHNPPLLFEDLRDKSSVH